MKNNTGLLNTLLQQAETAARRHSQKSRLTRQAIDRRKERCDSETVVEQLNAIYHNRISQLSETWRKAQHLSLNGKASW